MNDMYLPRAIHDQILDKDQKFLESLFAKYKRSWGLVGVFFYNVDDTDKVKILEFGGLEN